MTYVPWISAVWCISDWFICVTVTDICRRSLIRTCFRLQTYSEKTKPPTGALPNCQGTGVTTFVGNLRLFQFAVTMEDLRSANDRKVGQPWMCHQFWSSHTCKTSLANQGVCMAIPKHATETLHCLEQRYTKPIQNLRFGIMDHDTTIKGSHGKSIVFPAPDDIVSLPQDSALEQVKSPLIGLSNI